MTAERANLFNFSRAGLENWFVALGEERFRAGQLMRWVYQKAVLNFNDMSNLSKSLRAKLADCAELKLPAIQSEQVSTDGTRKWVLALAPEQCIEMVFIPEDRRGTLCVSSQVGCMLECSFCATGKQGFNGNLTAADIIGQLYLANQRLAEHPTAPTARITNLVFMGMGEPLLNFDAVLAASDIAMDDFAFGLSKRRVTISTAGVVPAIRRLAEASQVSLAVSLHAAEDSLRDILVPLNRKYPIADLLDVCHIYGDNLGKGRTVTMEYILIRDVNDSDKDAQQLLRLLCALPCKINLIPFNAFSGSDYQTPSPERIKAFHKVLSDAGFRVMVRTTRGADINAACGQLAGRFQDRTGRRLRRARQAGAGETLVADNRQPDDLMVRHLN